MMAGNQVSQTPGGSGGGGAASFLSALNAAKQQNPNYQLSWGKPLAGGGYANVPSSQPLQQAAPMSPYQGSPMQPAPSGGGAGYDGVWVSPGGPGMDPAGTIEYGSGGAGGGPIPANAQVLGQGGGAYGQANAQRANYLAQNPNNTQAGWANLLSPQGQQSNGLPMGMLPTTQNSTPNQMQQQSVTNTQDMLQQLNDYMSQLQMSNTFMPTPLGFQTSPNSQSMSPDYNQNFGFNTYSGPGYSPIANLT